MFKKDMSEEQIEQALEMSKKFMSPVMMTVFAYLGSLFFGLIISLVLAAVNKRENPNAAYNNLEA
jgi:flagellar biosynthesis protein FliQ